MKVIVFIYTVLASLVVWMVKNLPVIREAWVWTLGWEDPLENDMAAHSSTLPGESHGQRSLVGCSPWGRTESYKTEKITHTHTHTHTQY